MQVVVGRIVRPHGVKGEVAVDPATDRPAQRFAVGTRLTSSRGPALRVRSARPHAGRWLLAFDTVVGRDGAEALRGVDLRADLTPDDLADGDDYADVALVGCRVHDLEGHDVGGVVDVEHLPMQDLLVVTTGDDATVRIPFVAAIVTDVDLDAGVLTVDPPGGLLDTAEA